MPNTTRIRIEADGSIAIEGIGKVDLAMDRMGQRTGAVFGRLKNHWVEYTAGIYAAAAAMQKAWDFAEKAAAHAESLETLNALSSQYSITGREMAETISRNSEGLIGQAAAAKVAADAIAKGFTPAQLAQIARWAPVIDDFSSSVGSSAEAFETLVSSMAAGRERGTVQLLGATIDLKTAFGEQAASMSKAEKATALYNLVAQRMVEIQKAGVGSTDSLADKMERLKNQVEGLRLAVGDFIIRAGAGLLATFQSVSALALGLARVVMAPITALMLATDYLGITKGKAAEYKAAMDALGQATEYTAQQASDNFELMKKGLQAGTALNAAKTNLGFGAGDGSAAASEKAAEAYRKAKESMLGSLSKYYADSDALRKADETAEQAAFESRLGLQREYLHTGVTGISDIRKRTAEAYKDQKVLDEEKQAALDSHLGILRFMWAETKRQNEEELKLQREKLQVYLQIADAALKAGGQNIGSIPGMSEMYASMSGFVNAISNMNIGTGPWDAWAKAVEAKHAQVLESYKEGLATAEELDAAAKDKTRAREEADWMMRVQIAGAAMGVMANMATSLYVLQGQKGGAAFEMMKAFRIGETMINTYSAAVGAYNALASIPYVGPALGAAAAAAAIAFGMAQVQAISSMKPGGGSRSVSTAGLGGGASVSASASTSVEKKPEAVAPPIINVHIYGNVVDHDQFARELTPALQKAWADGAR